MTKIMIAFMRISRQLVLTAAAIGMAYAALSVGLRTALRLLLAESGWCLLAANWGKTVWVGRLGLLKKVGFSSG